MEKIKHKDRFVSGKCTNKVAKVECFKVEKSENSKLNPSPIPLVFYPGI